MRVRAAGRRSSAPSTSRARATRARSALPRRGSEQRKAARHNPSQPSGELLGRRPWRSLPNRPMRRSERGGRLGRHGLLSATAAGTRGTVSGTASRFRIDGTVIGGLVERDLERREPTRESDEALAGSRALQQAGHQPRSGLVRLARPPVGGHPSPRSTFGPPVPHAALCVQARPDSRRRPAVWRGIGLASQPAHRGCT